MPEEKCPNISTVHQLAKEKSIATGYNTQTPVDHKQVIATSSKNLALKIKNEQNATLKVWVKYCQDILVSS